MADLIRHLILSIHLFTPFRFYIVQAKITKI